MRKLFLIIPNPNNALVFEFSLLGVACTTLKSRVTQSQTAQLY